MRMGTTTDPPSPEPSVVSVVALSVLFGAVACSGPVPSVLPPVDLASAVGSGPALVPPLAAVREAVLVLNNGDEEGST